MTVKELIERLECEDPDTEVHFSFPSGDYWGTTISRTVDFVETGKVKYSDYHNTYKVVDEDDCDPEDEAIAEVLILS